MLFTGVSYSAAKKLLKSRLANNGEIRYNNRSIFFGEFRL